MSTTDVVARKKTAMMNERQGEIMASPQYSLRNLVEKWLAPTLTKPVLVTRVSRTRNGSRRHVYVEVAQPASAVVIVFFWHDDGSWSVFPPRRQRPALGYANAA